MLRLAFRVMADTRSADATPPLDGDPCAVDLEPPRRHGQPHARPPRSGPSASRSSSRPPSPCWLAEVDTEARALTVMQCPRSDAVMHCLHSALTGAARSPPEP